MARIPASRRQLIDHLGFAVRDLSEASVRFRQAVSDRLGISFTAPRRPARHGPSPSAGWAELIAQDQDAP
jgi:hypothetical protein